MLLPAQRRRAEHDAVVPVGRTWSGKAARVAEGGERRPIGFAALDRGLEREMQDAARRLDRRERPRMHLAEHDGAQRVREKLLRSDCNVRGHVRAVA